MLGVYSKSGRRTKTEGVVVEIKGEAVDRKHSLAPCLLSTTIDSSRRLAKSNLKLSSRFPVSQFTLSTAYAFPLALGVIPMRSSPSKKTLPASFR
jgi:hypothetical protein